MTRKGLCGALCAHIFGFALLFSGSASAVTVFAPTDNDVNFFNYSVQPGSLVAMFDDADTSYAGNSLPIPLPQVVGFSAGGINPGDYTATNEANNTLNLIGSDWFILAITHDSGSTWYGVNSVSPAATNALDITFTDGSILAVDARVVPVPAAVWLFASGLLGLIGMSRRKKAA
jgi:hypothetical protein